MQPLMRLFRKRHPADFIAASIDASLASRRAARMDRQRAAKQGCATASAKQRRRDPLMGVQA